MNLILHIAAKDLRRLKWALALWASAGLFAVFGANYGGVPQTTLEQLALVAMFQFFGLSVALIAAVVQEDGLTESTTFWRTRPISGGRLLAAKLGTNFVLFVLLPLSLLAIRWGVRGDGIVMICALVLMFTALASCCKDLGRYFLLSVISWFLVGFGTVALQWLKVSIGLKQQIRSTGFELIAVYGALIAIAVLLNQYRGHRFAVSVGLIVAGVVGAAAINAFWVWPMR